MGKVGIRWKALLTHSPETSTTHLVGSTTTQAARGWRAATAVTCLAMREEGGVWAVCGLDALGPSLSRRAHGQAGQAV